ncbi:hypothetical protein ACH4UT_34280 [Streptomyces sp. NPDC020799]|uniref:hypothetical protein n=1 Tax=Streptomyces sp. NPDC020799 TaxID=3365091 RepID=UPI0037B0B815
MTTEIERTELVVDVELVPAQPPPRTRRWRRTTQRRPPCSPALDQGADKHIAAVRPRKTKVSYARDWTLWAKFHTWLAGRTGTELPMTAVTKGTMVGFTVWLDEVREEAPNSIDRRITGVTVTARSKGATVPKEATLAARQLVKKFPQRPQADDARTGQGRPHDPRAPQGDEHCRSHCAPQARLPSAAP